MTNDLPPSARKEFERAVALSNQGQLATAEGIVRELETRYPRDVEVAHFGGALANRMKRFDVAVRRLERAVQAQPRRAKAHAALAFAQEQLGRLESASDSFNAAIRAEPGFAQAHNGKGVVLVKLGDPFAALPCFERAIALDAGSVEARLNAARALLDMGRDPEAAKHFRDAAGLTRNDETLRKIAEGLYLAADFDFAADLYRALLQRHGADASLRSEYALALESSGRSDEALEVAKGALDAGPPQAVSHNSYGQLLLNRHRYDEAIAQLRRALELDPGLHEAAFNLATALRSAGRIDEARDAMDALEPRLDAVGLASLATHYADLGDSARSIELAERAIARDPSIAAAHNTLALELLRTGDLVRGWREYAYRPWRGSEILAEVAAGSYPPPRPASLAGRDLVIHGEQGLGDVLFFLRYAKRLADAGAKLHAKRLDPRLVPMLERSIAIEAWPDDREVNDGTLQIWAGDLPSFTLGLGGHDEGTALPLSPLPERVARMRERLGDSVGPRIGVAWRAGTRPSASTGRRQFLWKDITPRMLGESLAGIRGTLVSIQRHPEPQSTRELEIASGARVIDCSDVNIDLEDMLALLSLLDDYAGVSSTNIHLRAGLGLGGRVLVPFPPDWRWQASGRSTWFPAFATYRQSAHRDWTQALTALRADLEGSR